MCTGTERSLKHIDAERDRTACVGVPALTDGCMWWSPVGGVWNHAACVQIPVLLWDFGKVTEVVCALVSISIK